MPLKRLPHIILTASPAPEPFKSRGGGPKPKALPVRDRQDHAEQLLGQLHRLQDEAARLSEELPLATLVGAKEGIHVQFEVEPGFPDALASLEDRRKKIEIVATRSGEGEKVLATVYVPKGELSTFERKIESYQTEIKKSGRPRHESLVTPISSIRLATLRAFWTDDDSEFPGPGVFARWEVWIRDDPVVAERFESSVVEAGIEISKTFLAFPERRVYLAHGTQEQLAASTEVLDAIAEIRRAKESRVFFVKMRGPEAVHWVDELLARTEVVPDPAAICLLDTGLNMGHPLLAPFVVANGRLAARPEWGPNDQVGHGTWMAGLALFGDLTPAIVGSSPISIHSLIESVKLMPPPPQQNPSDLHGVITRDAVNLIEISDPDRVRVFSMTVTTPDSRDRGQPSTWSAELDQLAAGVDGSPRLFVVSAGNSTKDARIHHPVHLATEQIHDPSQAWNAVTVGACTHLWEIEEPEFPDWTAVAAPGDLSPSTSTSFTWLEKPWPIKPEIVCEGGNCARDSGSTAIDDLDSLSLLTTSHQPLTKLFVTAGETSAACSLAARIAGGIRTRYPDLWPETVRGLLIHSAEWTEAMWKNYKQGAQRSDVERLLRYCGFGEPSFDRALWSAENDLALIAEATIQPFVSTGREIKLNEMHLHRIPWPSEALRNLGAASVELKVTLSYFVEPNPARRGWIRRHRYASHGLRFDMQTPTEAIDQFRARINKIAHDEDKEIAATASDSGDWLIGPKLRNKGSLHSDIWKGSAIDLASREYIAVYPVGGWWKERPNLQRGDENVRYSLIVSVKTPNLEVDLYTPIANSVGIPTVIET